MNHRTLLPTTVLASLIAGSTAAVAAPGTFTLFDEIPQFGIYVSTPPNYVPPPGVIMQNNGTTFLTKLTSAEKAMVGADVQANITYLAQCDNYDRIGSLFMIIEPTGVAPQSGDPQIELARWITPFSDYWQGQYATHAYPAASLAPFASTLADKKHDIWIGIQGGSNPYDGDPCTTRSVDPDFAAIGFKYTVALSSTRAARAGAASVLSPVPAGAYTTVPVTGSATSPLSGPGTAIVIVSGHGSATGGDEYKHTMDTLSFNGTAVGTFNTQANCSSYRKYSPDGNPFIFIDNNGSNPRNWCPGELVPSHTFPVTVDGQNGVSLDMSDESVPDGSYYQTSIAVVVPKRSGEDK